MGEITRKWTIPATGACPELTLEIREPAYTGDNIGMKTWGTALAFAKLLGGIGSKHLGHLLAASRDGFTSPGGSMVTRPRMRVLEYVLQLLTNVG